MERQEKTSLPVTWQALEITFLAFSWKLKCRRGSGRDPSTLRFTGSGVGSCRGSVGGQPGAGVRGGCSCRAAALGAGWSGKGQKAGWKSKEGCQAGVVGEVRVLLGAGLQYASGGCAELRRVSRCKLLQPCSLALLSSPTWLCAHACSPKGKCEKAEAVYHPL